MSMKTIFKSLAVVLGFGALLSLSACGDVSGRIGLGKYGDITSGTYNLDLSPVIDNMAPSNTYDESQNPPPMEY